MIRQLIALAFTAAFTSAIPAGREFSLIASEVVTGKNHSLLAVCNGTADERVVQVKPLSTPGTPVFFNATRKTKYFNFHALNFVLDINDQMAYYGLGVPEVGDDYGDAESVLAIHDYQQIKWSVTPAGQILHDLQAALNSFYICNDHADEGAGRFLKWGTPNNNGSNPEGCTLVGLYK